MQKNFQERKQREQVWLSIDPAARNEMKSRLVQTLASPNLNASESAANVIARIAQIELPEKQWPELASGLLSVVGNPNLPPNHKIAALKTLGFICEDIHPDALEKSSDSILSAVIQGIRRETQNVEMIVAAGDALFNCLKFIEKNFNNPEEQAVIMNVLIDSASIPHDQIQTTLLMCLVKIAHLYYHTLEPYMERLFPLTLAAMKSESHEVACQAIEFWSTICDEEYELMEDGDNLYLIQKALKYLIPPLVESVTNRSDDEDDDESLNVAISALKCVESIAIVVGDEILNELGPFIQENIQNPDPQRRDTATLLFAHILDGPSKIPMGGFVRSLLPVLFEQLKFNSKHLKNTTCWAIGCICHFFPEIPVEFLEVFVNTIGPLLINDSADISKHCCYAIHNIAEAFQSSRDSNTCALTKYYQQLISALVDVAYRSDGNEIGLRASAFEAITTIIRNGSLDTHAVDLEAIPFFLTRLSATFQMKIETNQDREIQIELQGYLCIILRQITLKVGSKIYPYHNKILELLLGIFQYHANTSKATIHDDVIEVLGAVASAIEGEFATYFPHFVDFVLRAFKCTQDPSLISKCVGLVSDVCLAMKKQFTPHCKDILIALFVNLQDTTLERYVKPQIITCFGDIAGAVGENFVEYLQVFFTALILRFVCEYFFQEVCNVLALASMTPMEPNDEDFEDFLGNLRISIFDAYSGIIQGLRQDKKDNLFLSTQANGSPLFQFIENLVNEMENDCDIESKRDEILKGMVGVIGDFAEVPGPEVPVMLNRECVHTALKRSRNHEEKSVRQVGDWAFMKVQALFPR